MPNPIDVHVGSRVRLGRTLLGMSQKKLGEAIGSSYQQLQKYESGSNRIGASRLFDLARVLDVPIGFFFDDMSEDVTARSLGQSMGAKGEAMDVGPNPMDRHETLELVRAYFNIQNATVRKRVYELAKALAVDYEPK